MRRFVPLIGLVTALAGCSEPTTFLEPVTSSSIQDAVHQSGNEHFFWLPPMVQAPAYSGTFDGSLDPVVRICEWDGSACVLPPVAEFTTATGPGGETVGVAPEDELNKVNWHTDEFGLDPALTYRIVASVDGQELGHADVDVVSNGSQLRNVDTDEYIALKDGRTLPIKFRIEEGAVSSCAVVTIPDPALEARVRGLLGIPTGPITGAAAASLTGYLIASDLGISSIEGLQCFTGLTHLNLPSNQITDLGPIAGLTGLVGMFLRGNQISDLTPLADLTALTSLAIDDNPITDLTGLESLGNLTYLDLFDTGGITDVSPLANLGQLTTLRMNTGALGGAAPLANLVNMENLTLSNSGVTDLAFMASMTHLQTAVLDGNPFSDLGPLAGLTGLTSLRIEQNQVTDLSPLSGLAGLTDLDLYDGPGIADISPLAGLTNLTRFSLQGSVLGTSASTLANFTQLEYLRIQDSDLTDVSFVQAMPSLETVLLRRNQIADATPILGLANLASLDLLQNPVTCDDPFFGLLPAALSVLCNEAPVPIITAPIDGAEFVEGETITLEGSATDPESGAVSGAGLAWSSDLDGPLGSGSPLSTSALTPGTHTLTLTATDPFGGTGSTSIGVEVSPAFSGSTTYVFDVTSGNAGVQGVGSQGPEGNEIAVTIEAGTGAATFGPYVHRTFTASLFPPEVLGVTLEILSGTGTYDFVTGAFSGLEFVIRVTEPGGSFTDTAHTFTGSTTPALTVPAGSLPTGAVLQVAMSPSFAIALPGGYQGNLSFVSQVVSFTDDPG